jgi:hypothetical protein
MTRVFPISWCRLVVSAVIILIWSATAAGAGTVELAWDPNQEPDVAGYIVFYGTSSRQYTGSVDVGNKTFFQFAEPDPGSRYYFAVRAYTVSGSQSDLSAEISTPDPLTLEGTSVTANTPVAQPLETSVSLTANRRAPEVAGTPITITATAMGGTAPYQFKWLIASGEDWSVARDWSMSSKYVWIPTAANANYRVMVWVRSAASRIDAAEGPRAVSSIPFAITPGVAVTRLKANKSAPRFPGSQIVFTAAASGATSYKYKWWVFNGATWAIAQEWSSTNTFIWRPTAANANYQVLVRARDNSSPSRASAGTAIPFPIQREP